MHGGVPLGYQVDNQYNASQFENGKLQIQIIIVLILHAKCLLYEPRHLQISASEVIIQ